MEEFGERLEKAITAKGMTLMKFSEKYGFSYRTIHSYTVGDRTPTLQMLKEICEDLEISADWLIWGKEEEK